MEKQTLIQNQRRHNFFMVDNELIDHHGREIGVYGVALYSLLCRHSYERIVKVPQRELARQLNMGAGKVSETLRLLASKKLITYEAGRVESVVTLLDLKCSQSERSHTERSHTERGALNQSASALNTSANNEQDYKTIQDSYSNEFEMFWKVYPRRVAKRRAWKSYKAALKRLPSETKLFNSADDVLINCAEKYAASKLRTEERFIAHPATWLNDSRYLDEYSESQRNVSSERSSSSLLDEVQRQLRGER